MNYAMELPVLDKIAKAFLIHGMDPHNTPQHMASQITLSCTGTFLRPSFCNNKSCVKCTAQIGPRTTRNTIYNIAKTYSVAGSALERSPALDMSDLVAACEIRTRFIMGAVISPRNMRAMALR
jgi:hypothetical protein